MQFLRCFDRQTEKKIHLESLFPWVSQILADSKRIVKLGYSGSISGSAEFVPSRGQSSASCATLNRIYLHSPVFVPALAPHLGAILLVYLIPISSPQASHLNPSVLLQPVPASQSGLTIQVLILPKQSQPHPPSSLS